MTKEPIEVLSEVSGLLPSTIERNYKWVLEAMKQYAKIESIWFCKDVVENIEVNGIVISKYKEIDFEQLYELCQQSKK